MIYIIGLFFIGVFILILSKKIEKKFGLKKARFQFGIEPICFVESPMFAELLAGGGYIGTYLCYGAALVAVGQFGKGTSILPVFLTISVSMWLMDLAFMMIGAIIEWGERSFMEIYFQSNLIEFCRIHFLITMTVPLIISGILMGVISKIGIRKVLGKYNMFKF